MIKIKNNTENQVVWCGMAIEAGTYYEVQTSELAKWQNDSTLLSAIATAAAIVNNGTSDILDVASAINHLKDIVVTEIDVDGRQIVRSAAGKPGWTYLAHFVEFQTAKLGSVYEKNHLGVDRGVASIKFYDSSDNEVVASENESLITKTVLLIKPGYDFELLAGQVQQVNSPTSDLRVWVIGGIIELGGPYVKEFCGGANMKFLAGNEALKTDGRAAKFMRKDTAGVPYQTNQVQIIIRHEAGYQHPLMLVLEYFRA